MRAITVVTPCFNEELNVQECYEAVRNLFANELAAYRREHIFCDNASTDGNSRHLAEDRGRRSVRQNYCQQAQLWAFEEYL